MSEGNKTLVTEFVLTGITEQSQLQFLHFPHVLGHLPYHYGMQPQSDSHIHMSTCFSLGGLAFVDACTLTFVTPRM